ncbi:YdcH family protein [Roseibium sp.]|uniref:YdcH family protein n=1 Tax=Roseibium sp. TaxID=1936156 RepID=UPI003BB0FA2D
MAQQDSEALRMELAQLRQEHRDLDVAVEALAATSNHDVLQLQRLKKKKLMIKDRISVLEDQLFPDIIA